MATIQHLEDPASICTKERYPPSVAANGEATARQPLDPGGSIDRRSPDLLARVSLISSNGVVLVKGDNEVVAVGRGAIAPWHIRQNERIHLCPITHIEEVKGAAVMICQHKFVRTCDKYRSTFEGNYTLELAGAGRPDVDTVGQSRGYEVTRVVPRLERL